MEQLNDLLLDTNYNHYTYFDEPPTNTIDNGLGFNFSTNYQPMRFQSFGIYGGFQKGKIYRYGEIEYVSPTGGSPSVEDTSYIYLDYKKAVYAFSGGIFSITYLDGLLIDSTNTFWNKASLGLEVRGGIAYAEYRATRHTYDLEGTSGADQNIFHNKIDFHGQVSLNFDYDLLTNPFITSMGIKAGYQTIVTKTIEDESGPDYTSDGKRINLDFSGLFVGAYFSIGK